MAAVAPVTENKPKRPPPKSVFKPGDPRINRVGKLPGTVNKINQSFKDVLMEAVNLLGGARGLVKWVQKNDENERLFWTEIAPKVLPRVLEGNPDAPIPLQVIERRVIDPPDDVIDGYAVDVTEEGG
jgi:hypothetical protein